MAIQKATELGVSTFTPLLSERVVVNRKNINSDRKKEKWYQTARGACEQCGENWLPSINEPISIKEWSLGTILLY